MQNLRDRCHPSCRTCTNECLLLQRLKVNGLGLSELKEASVDGQIPFACNACNLCSVVCNRRLNPAELMHSWRQEIADSALGIPAELEPRLTDHSDNIYAVYKCAYPAEATYPEGLTAETVFFPGCALSAYTPELALAAYNSLQRYYPEAGWLDGCCFDLLDKLGLEERYRRAQQSLAEQAAHRGIRRIVTACPTCHYRLSAIFPELKVISIYQLLMDERCVVEGVTERIAVHDSCADRSKQEIGRAARALLPSVDKLKHEGKRSLCCGAGGGVNFSHPELAREVASHRMQEVKTNGTQRLIVYCVNCALQLTEANSDIPVTHILELALNCPQDFGQVAARIRNIR